MQGSGVYYADSFITELHYEVYSMGPESQKSVLRASWNLSWVDEPWMISNQLKSVVESKLKVTFDYFWNTHLPRSVSNYVRPTAVDINDDTNDQASDIISKSQTSEEIDELKSLVRKQMSVIT